MAAIMAGSAHGARVRSLRRSVAGNGPTFNYYEYRVETIIQFDAGPRQALPCTHAPSVNQSRHLGAPAPGKSATAIPRQRQFLVSLVAFALRCAAAVAGVKPSRVKRRPYF